MRSAPDLDPQALGALYDEGYYHGVNSGYPSVGYERVHASWAHWVAYLAARCARGARWLDLGCAYGYLVAEAGAGGFRAAGLDVSAYALGRVVAAAPAAAGKVARAVLERLPLADESVDVVSAFDVLEHVVDPEPALAEVRRVLRPGGVLIGATPDPLLFDRHEETHFSERPPSYWVDRLLALGFTVDFRFYEAPFNLEVLARRDGAPGLAPAACLRWDGFAVDADLPIVSGAAASRVAVRLRSGFGSAGSTHPPDLRWVGAGEAGAYVLITGRAPARLRVRLEVCGDAAGADVTVVLDDFRLARARVGPGWSTLECPPLPVAAGGHALRVRTSGPLLFRRLEVVADDVAGAELVLRLPFDMHQRYAQCRAVLARLPGRHRTILDVGGVLGGGGGHLATSGDFLPEEQPPLSTDVRASDHPDHRAVAPGRLPFADESFDVVLCLDVLEHVAVDERRALLDELARVTRRFVLLAAPFATAGVADSDQLLFALIEARHGYAHQFLREHLAHGHPDLAGTVAYWEAAGARVVVLPNGYLPYWHAMQILNLPLAEPVMGERYARAQAAYNQVVHDWREPAYRHLLAIDVRGGDDWCAAVRALADTESAAAATPVSVARAAAVLSAVVDLARAADPVHGGGA
ncbi:MAG: methyltransferase domain-containing protein [Deltaproteobacteria bacterium]|nr:methyltransferase domain-containing protein [Deltaproteobacteria bacterium]